MQIKANGVKGKDHVAYFWIFGTLFISPKRLKLEISNFLAHRQLEVLTKNIHIRSNGVKGRGHVTYC